MPKLDCLLIPASKLWFALLRGLDAWLGRLPVSELTTEELQEKYARSPEQRDDECVLVDVRSDQEQQTSMIPYSITRRAFEESIDRHRNKHVIAYCTAGGRSFLFARKLAKQGFHTSNLTDGIVGWCKLELPLVTINGVPTESVHLNHSTNRVPARYKVVDSLLSKAQSRS